MTAEGAAVVLTGPLASPGPGDDGTVVERADGWWLVSERAPSAALRLSDVNPSGKVEIRVAPDADLALLLGVGSGRAELFDDGTMLVGLAPGEWLALTPGVAADLAVQVAGLAGDGDHPVIADRSDGLALFRLTGPAASSVLAACCDALPGEDGTVLTAPVAGCRCHVVRDDVVRDAVPDDDPADDDTALSGGGHAAVPTPSYLVVCDRSLAPSLHAALLVAGEPFGIEPEGFAAYRAQRRDV